MGIFRNIIDLIKPGPKQSFASIKIAYQPALSSGNTHEGATLYATHLRFNFRGPAGLLFGQELTNEMIVELLKAVEEYRSKRPRIPQNATFV
jgi:hypothetical protein